MSGPLNKANSVRVPNHGPSASALVVSWKRKYGEKTGQIQTCGPKSRSAVSCWDALALRWRHAYDFGSMVVAGDSKREP